MTHKVNARNGSRQTKNEITTAASIRITCLRYLMKLLRLPCAEIRLGLIIRCLAITEYSTTRISSGRKKKTDMVPMKKTCGQNSMTLVWHTGT